MFCKMKWTAKNNVEWLCRMSGRVVAANCEFVGLKCEVERDICFAKTSLRLRTLWSVGAQCDVARDTCVAKSSLRLRTMWCIGRRDICFAKERHGCEVSRALQCEAELWLRIARGLVQNVRSQRYTFCKRAAWLRGEPAIAS